MMNEAAILEEQGRLEIFPAPLTALLHQAEFNCCRSKGRSKPSYGEEAIIYFQCSQRLCLPVTVSTTYNHAEMILDMVSFILTTIVASAVNSSRAEDGGGFSEATDNVLEPPHAFVKLGCYLWDNKPTHFTGSLPPVYAKNRKINKE